eukprot:scaffold97252_cov64-Phaeocystis_antarctica.AAC.3
MLPIDISVLGWRSPSVSLLACRSSAYNGLASSSWPMARSSEPILLSEANRLLEQWPRLLKLAHVLQQPPQVVDQHGRPPLGCWQSPQCLPRLSDQRLAQQADDQRVALGEAHVLLQLAHDARLVNHAAALCLPVAEEELIRALEVGWRAHMQ